MARVPKKYNVGRTLDYISCFPPTLFFSSSGFISAFYITTEQNTIKASLVVN